MPPGQGCGAGCHYPPRRSTPCRRWSPRSSAGCCPGAGCWSPVPAPPGGSLTAGSPAGRELHKNLCTCKTSPLSWWTVLVRSILSTRDLRMIHRLIQLLPSQLLSPLNCQRRSEIHHFRLLFLPCLAENSPRPFLTKKPTPTRPRALNRARSNRKGRRIDPAVGVVVALRVVWTFCAAKSVLWARRAPCSASIHPAALIKGQDVPHPLRARGSMAGSQSDGREATRGPENHQRSSLLPVPPAPPSRCCIKGRSVRRSVVKGSRSRADARWKEVACERGKWWGEVKSCSCADLNSCVIFWYFKETSFPLWVFKIGWVGMKKLKSCLIPDHRWYGCHRESGSLHGRQVSPESAVQVKCLVLNTHLD